MARDAMTRLGVTALVRKLLDSQVAAYQSRAFTLDEIVVAVERHFPKGELHVSEYRAKQVAKCAAEDLLGYDISAA